MPDEKPSESAPPPSMPPSSMSPSSLLPAAKDNRVLAPAWFFFLFITTIAGLAYTLKPFVADLVLAFVLVGLFNGTFDRIRAKIGGRGWLASAATTSWIMLVVAVPVAAVGYLLAIEAFAAFDATRQALSSPTQAMALIERARVGLASLGVHVRPEHVAQFTLDSAGYARDFLVQQVSLLVNNALAVTFHFTIVMVIVFYLFVDGPRLKRFLFDLSPLPDDEEELLVRKFVEVSKGILIGNGIGSVLQGVLGGIGMWVAGVPAPLLWGVIMTLLAFLGVLGVSFVCVPATIYLALTGSPAAAIGFFLYCMGQATIVENVIKTRLIGTQTRMHDLLVFLSVVGGLFGFGILGLLYGPIIAILFLTFTELYRRTYRHAVAERFARVV
jgi:predicted PurR-regulated permease PerM